MSSSVQIGGGLGDLFGEFDLDFRRFAGALGVPLAVRFFDVDVGSTENFGGVGTESGTGASM